MKVQFKRGNFMIFVNCSFEDASLCVGGSSDEREIFKRGAKPNASENPLDLVPRQEDKRGISAVKYEELLKLTVSMPADRRHFFTSLVVTDVDDLNETRNIDY